MPAITSSCGRALFALALALTLGAGVARAADAPTVGHAVPGLIVIGLSVDDRHDRADALKAARDQRYALGMLSEATRNDFGSPRSLPLTYVIDGDGVIRTVLSANRGPVSAEAVRSAVTALLP